MVKSANAIAGSMTEIVGDEKKPTTYCLINLWLEHLYISSICTVHTWVKSDDKTSYFICSSPCSLILVHY